MTNIRNKNCPCGSNQKYKLCCEPKGKEAARKARLHLIGKKVRSAVWLKYKLSLELYSLLILICILSIIAVF